MPKKEGFEEEKVFDYSQLAYRVFLVQSALRKM
jgi:hypothetical protein